MELDIVVRGQSNAILMLEHGRFAGARLLEGEVERLLGFDGVQDRVDLVYDRDARGGATAFGGTAFLGDWMRQEAGGAWQPARLENLFLERMRDYARAEQGDGTVILWMHSEYDSREEDLPTAGWMEAVRADMALTREVLGTPAPYLFVAAHPYGDGTDEGHQAIRRGMEALAADPAADARIAARAPDIDADNDDWDGRGWTREYGGAHISEGDALLIAGRAARSIAETWAAHARPGSPVALAGGNLANEGPEVVAATRLADGRVQASLLHDGVAELAGFGTAQASGLGWSALLPDGRRIAAVEVRAPLETELLVRFAEAVPAGAVLDYAWGKGRVAEDGGPGRDMTITDAEGLPLWTPAAGLVVAEPPPIG